MYNKRLGCEVEGLIKVHIINPQNPAKGIVVTTNLSEAFCCCHYKPTEFFLLRREGREKGRQREESLFHINRLQTHKPFLLNLRFQFEN